MELEKIIDVVAVNININNLDSYNDKAKQYVQLLKEAKTLTEELAS